MKPEPQVFFRPYLGYIKLDWAEDYISPNYAGISGFPGGSTPGQLTGNPRAWHGICFKITSRRPGI
jgi:hypothetical protein